MGSSSKNKPPEGAQKGPPPQAAAPPGGMVQGMGAPGAGAPVDPAQDQRMRAMLAQMMQRDEMLKRSQMMDTSGRGGRGMGGAFGNGFGGGVGGNTPGGGYGGGGKRGGGLY